MQRGAFVDKKLKNSLIIVGFGVALYAALMNLGPLIRASFCVNWPL